MHLSLNVRLVLLVCAEFGRLGGIATFVGISFLLIACVFFWMVGLAAIIARFFEVWFYLAFGLAKQLLGFGSPFNLGLAFILIVALGLGMRTLAWNCQGAGRAPAIRDLKALIREESLDVVFIAESKSKSCRIERIRSSIGFVDKFCVDPVGKSGGPAIFWKAGVDLEIVYFDKNVIASLVYSDPSSSPWLFLLIYGPSHVNGRARFWKFLEDLVSAFAGSRLVMRDFNYVDNNLDKEVVDILVKVQLKALAILFMVLGKLILVLLVLNSRGLINMKALPTLKRGWTKLCATKSGNAFS